MSGRGKMGSVATDGELRGGVLVFFPSYGIMDSTVKRWQQTDLYNSLATAGGEILIEPRGASASSAAGRNDQNNSKATQSSSKKVGNSTWITKSSSLPSSSKSSVPDEVEDAEQQFLGWVGKFESILRNRGRCILLAVCRLLFALLSLLFALLIPYNLEGKLVKESISVMKGVELSL